MTNSEESSLYEKSLFRSTCTTHGWGGGRSAGDRQLIHTVQLFKKKWLFILQASHTCWVHVYMYDVLEMANGACNLDGHETVMLLLWFTTLTLLYYITTALSPGKCLNMCEAEKGLLLKCTKGPVNRFCQNSLNRVCWNYPGGYSQRSCCRQRSLSVLPEVVAHILQCSQCTDSVGILNILCWRCTKHSWIHTLPWIRCIIRKSVLGHRMKTIFPPFEKKQAVFPLYLQYTT